jgi:hypothetical protein
LGRKKKKKRKKKCLRNSVSLFIRGRRSSTLPSWSGKKLKKEKVQDCLNISHVLPDEKDNDDMDYI